MRRFLAVVAVLFLTSLAVGDVQAWVICSDQSACYSSCFRSMMGCSGRCSRLHPAGGNDWNDCGMSCKDGYDTCTGICQGNECYPVY